MITKLAFYQIGMLSTNRTFQYRVHEPLPFMIMHAQRLIPYSNAIGHPPPEVWTWGKRSRPSVPLTIYAKLVNQAPKLLLVFKTRLPVCSVQQVTASYRNSDASHKLIAVEHAWKVGRMTTKLW